MAVLSILYIFAVIPMVVVAQKNVAAVVIEGNGAGRCPSLEQLDTHRRLLDDRVLSALQYFNVEQCGDGVWYRALSVNMSDANSQCPSGWVEESAGGLRTCGRGTVGAGCRSVYISSDNRDYTKICGRAIGYQFGSTDGFGPSFYDNMNSLDQIYVDGLSITYGSPRQHVWTYASAVREGNSTYIGSNCPCSSYPGALPPPVIGNNWYCESGNPNSTHTATLYSNDPIWDGEDCEGTCCSNGKSPPWFSVELPRSTSENIEARICASEDNANEDVFISILEIYIQ